ncbi:unnamed protein product [Lymnaea stagnalis]|uniref:G-protein coupled receptors family 1 profile domain-containing protein n=1 Tax=Lymnaea stagnalis TaxID=6523 RepID=A0AAV2IFZ7_LYMST
MFLSNSTTFTILMFNYVALGGTMGCVGCLGNAVNAYVFVKMGIRDTVNISLLGLAISDFLALLFLLSESVCLNPMFQDTGVPVVLTEIEYVVGGWPHVCFTRVTSWITAFVTFERCLCIACPLKVKRYVTPTRAKLFICAMFLLVLASAAPEFFVNQFTWKFYPERNRTMLGLRFIEDRTRFEIVTLVLNNVIMQYFAFLAVIVFTITLAAELNQKSKWRSSVVKADNPDDIPRKDKKVVKLITLISTTFILSYLPSSILFLAMAVEHEFHPDGYYNIFYVTWSFAYVMEGLNASLNIFVYFTMSSRFRGIVYKTFL